jgi:hypothetical protein
MHMPFTISRPDAVHIVNRLMNSPIAPGSRAHFINVGTDHILNSLEENYFRGQLAEGISCFKYLEGDYGSGKTQFIQSLADRARRHGVVSAVVSIGQDCPFNSPLAIYKAVMGAFLAPAEGDAEADGAGIDVLIQTWIRRQLREMGVTPGHEVPDQVQRQVAGTLGGLWTGAPDGQTATALAALGRRLLAIECGAAHTGDDRELIAWVKGDKITSRGLRDRHNLYEPAKDENAFRRLKTVIGFLRTRMGCRGFFIAFDEGGRAISFRRGSLQQRQAIENMLTMINENADGQFGGVMFMYSSVPDFRNGVIKDYIALRDRIGSTAFSRGSPMVPFINLEIENTDQITRAIGERLREVIGVAQDTHWDDAIQEQNVSGLIASQKDVLALLNVVPPRVFVYQYCRFLSQQRGAERLVDDEEMRRFVANNDLEKEEAAS